MVETIIIINDRNSRIDSNILVHLHGIILRMYCSCNDEFRLLFQYFCAETSKRVKKDQFFQESCE